MQFVVPAYWTTKPSSFAGNCTNEAMIRVITYFLPSPVTFIAFYFFTHPSQSPFGFTDIHLRNFDELSRYGTHQHSFLQTKEKY
jgi:hypothetical protein